MPLERDLGDYAESMLEVAKAVARQENREIQDVLHDLARPRVDTLRFEILGGANEQCRTFRLYKGIAFVEGAKNALMASAYAVRNRCKYHPRLSISEAEVFVEIFAAFRTSGGTSRSNRGRLRKQ